MTLIQNYIEKELQRVKRGGGGHQVWAQKYISGHGQKILAEHDPVVGMCGDDPHYTEYFQNREELETFIVELRKAAEEAWGAP